MPKPTRPRTKWDKEKRIRYGTDRQWMICDKQNPDALIFHIWPQFAAKICDLDKRMPDIWKLSERKMQLWVKPTKLLDQLRCIFWARVYDCRALGTRVKKEEVLVGLLDETTWEKIIHIDANLAYFIRPIPRIEAAFESLMWRSLRNLAEMVEMPEDFMLESHKQKQNYLAVLFHVIRQCEFRLGRTSASIQRETIREKLMEEIEAEGKSLNITKPENEPDYLKDFDLEDFESLDLEEEGQHGSDTWKGDVDLSEDGSQPGGEKEKVDEGGSGEDQESPPA